MANQRSKIKDQRHKSKIKKFIFFIFIFEILFFIFSVPMASAQGTSLRLSPSVLKVKLEAPTELNAPVSIENLTDQAVDLKTEFRLFKASAENNGQIEYLPTKDNKSNIFQHIALMDGDINLNTLTLGPRQKKNLTLRINIEDDEATQDYYFSVIYTRIQDTAEPATAASEQHSISRVNAGIAMNVLLSIQNQNSNIATASIDEFSSPKYIEKGPLDFILKLRNNGSNYISAKGEIEITNMFGQLIGRVDLPATTVLANSSRYLATQDQRITDNSSRITPPDQSSIISNKLLVPKALWQENFLLGFYKAIVKIETSPDDPVLTKTIHFIALPFRLITTFILTIIVFLIIRRRVKRKMSTR